MTDQNDTTSSHTILTGVNYLPQIGMIEDFSPLWIFDRWTVERMEEDFRIMASLGMSLVRFHISPGDPSKVVYPGLKPDKYLEMVDAAIEMQDRYGIRILLDIGAFPQEVNEESVRLYVGRYKGRIDYFQLGNELYDDMSNVDTFKRMVELIRLGRSIDPDAKFSSDVKSGDLYKYREEMPDAVAEFDFHPIHFYCPVDHHGWDDTSVDVFKRYCSTDEVVEYPQGYHVVAWCRGHGFGGLEKERWVTEACGQGYFRWGNVTEPDVAAEGWRKIMAASRVEHGPRVVMHHCFRDKMSWREFGIGQSGVVALDGAPKGITQAFLEESIASMPDHDIRKHIHMSILACSTDCAKVHIENHSDRRIEGELAAHLHDQITPITRIEIEPDKALTLSVNLTPLNFTPGRNNVFASLKTTQGNIWAYNTATRAEPIALEQVEPFDGVLYPDGFDAVEQFLNHYGQNLPIITGPFIGNECEPAYRIKCVLDHLLGGDARIIGSMNATEVTRQPFAVISTTQFNPLIQIMTYSMPPERCPDQLLQGDVQGFVQLVAQPFGDNRNNMAQRCVGIRQPKDVPAALYIGGRDVEGLKLATYDLIRRFWPNNLGEPLLTKDAKDMLDK